jgi:flagellin
MTVVKTSISALTAQDSQLRANNMMGLAMQRLLTGQRISSAKDDPAGLAISQKMIADVRGLAVAIDALPLSYSGLNKISPAV